MRTILLPLVLSLAMLGIAFAEPGTIQVTGTGRVMAKPNLAEIQLRISGQSQLAEEAIKKYGQALQQAQTAIENLKMDNLKVEMLGLGLTQVGQNNQMFVNGQPQADTKQPITVAKQLRLTLGDLENYSEDDLSKTLAKILDAAKDAGATVKQGNMMAQYWGQQVSNTMVYFIVDGIDDAREKAYSEAMRKARNRADRLAKLAGVKIKGVHSIQESFALPADEASQRNQILYAMYGVQQGEKQEQRVLSSEYKPVGVEVTLTVNFQME